MIKDHRFFSYFNKEKGRLRMKCRVLDLPTEDAETSIALDQILLENAEEIQEFAIAFTRWRPTVSIGNSQSLHLDVDQESCKRNGVAVVRRFSGGQAVYVDESYLNFVVVGPRTLFPVSLTELRKQLCDAIIRALQRFKIPAKFYKPDNVIISIPRTRTLGNSGQVIKAKAIFLQASIRYDLSETSLRRMLEVLKTNGQSLRDFKTQARNALAWVSEFTSAGHDEIREALLESLLETYDCKTFYRDVLTLDEIRRIGRTVTSLQVQKRLEDKETYQSRGVCYFYLNGECIIPEIAELLPYNRPSTYADSTIA